MKKIVVGMLILCLFMSACTVEIPGYKGSGKVKTETREVSGFSEISLSGVGTVKIRQGEEESLLVTAEDNILDRITTKVVGNRLEIDFKDGFNIIPTEPIEFEITVKDLTALTLSGAGDIEIYKLETDSFKVDLSGAGNVEIEELKADRLDVSASGAGSFKISGEVLDQVVTMSAAGGYDAADLKSERADITVSGVGSASVWATEALDVTISGAGSIKYYGNPKVSEEISGAGSVKSMGEH